MPLARQLSAPGNINLLGFGDANAYGIGQILGPLAASLSSNGASAIINATLCGAAARSHRRADRCRAADKTKRFVMRE